MTINLPENRLQQLLTALQSFTIKQQTSKGQWQRVLGILHSTTPAIYGATHYFSLLEHALQSTCQSRIKITPLMKQVLREWITLATTVSQQPVSIHSIVPRQPTTIVATDALPLGMGGFHITPTER
jgi:hypothetical protein